MSFGPDFVVAIILITTVGWVVTTAIRARHGYPLEGEWGATVHKKDPETDVLKAQNQDLKATVGRLEERLKVLERITTDPSRQLDDDIEQLR
ncbi:MAG: hypothetical protein H0W71_02140 [Sphingomonas sp.]|nr:hypothetical protein [Sphingomonas sp.]